jgi:regulator of protease activity HflC (stomatin/prohibitin superfamily)
MAIFDSGHSNAPKLNFFSMNGNWLKKAAASLVILWVLWWLAPFVIVPAGHRGVITTFGKVDEIVLGEGIHFRIPIVNQIHLIDVRVQKGEGQGDAASRDLQTIQTTVALNYHLRPDRVAITFRDIGGLAEVEQRIILPSTQEGVKAITARYTAEELISKREEVRNNIRAFLEDRLGRHGILVDEFSVTNFDFSKSFNDAIEAKTTAEQLKLKAERDLQRIQVEAEQKIASAKAEAESLRLQKQEISPELLKLREIEAQRLAIEKWNGVLPTVTGGAVPFIKIDK